MIEVEDVDALLAEFDSKNDSPRFEVQHVVIDNRDGRIVSAPYPLLDLASEVAAMQSERQS